MNPAEKSAENKSVLSPQDAFDNAMKSIEATYGLTLETYVPPKDAPLSGNVDVRFRMTAILVDTPQPDVQFMVLSDQGIKLPDTDGSIHAYVRTNDFSIQKVNEMLWQQAVVWPVGHMSLGIWKKQESRVSLKNSNLVLPPLDLQWIERD